MSTLCAAARKTVGKSNTNSQKQSSTASPEHILFFLIDDYGFADASYKNRMYNGTAAPPTPTIDSLAMSGVRLESYYVNSLCSPTRTALLSGRYAYTIGMENTVIVDGQDVDLPLNLLTMADYFWCGRYPNHQDKPALPNLQPQCRSP